VYTNWAEVPKGWPTYLHALQAVGYHTCQLGKAHLTRDDAPDMHFDHVDELAGHLHDRGFTEVHETGDKFIGTAASRYTDHLAARGLLDAYRKHIADRSYHGENESGVNATKQVPMWDATPSPLPLADYVDAWHGDLAVDWVNAYDRAEPFFLFVGFPGPHDPWDAPREAVERYGVDNPMRPSSTTRPDMDRLGNYGKLLRGMLSMSDTKTMTDDAIAGMRRAYFANVAVIDDAVGRIGDTLRTRDMLDDTWIFYTSDHGEMAGDHGFMSKCVLYEGAVRVPLIVRPPEGCDARVVADLVEHVDVPATVRAVAGAPAVPDSAGRSLLPYLTGDASTPRDVAISEDWGFASFETERYKLVVDEDAHQPVQLFDLDADPAEDDNLAFDDAGKAIVGELMERYVAPFLRVPPQRPHRSPFA
jgi:choline-sulfatase